MYKIYINGTPLYLVEKEDFESFPTSGPQRLQMRFNGNSKQILQIVDMLEKSHRWESITLIANSIEELWEVFKSRFKIIKAAGGLVENEFDEILWIFRRGYWDLPKGKIDPGEKKRAAAIREVSEETGIHHLIISHKLPVTYHTYRTAKGKRILKKTYWFQMHTRKQDLVPETEEDIELAVWKSRKSFVPPSEEVYGNILDVISAYVSDK